MPHPAQTWKSREQHQAWPLSFVWIVIAGERGQLTYKSGKSDPRPTTRFRLNDHWSLALALQMKPDSVIQELERGSLHCKPVEDSRTSDEVFAECH